MEEERQQAEAEVSRRSEEEFLSGNSMGKTFESLEQAGLKRDDILTLHYTEMGNISDLFANGERMKFERAYKKKDVRKGMIHVFSPFTVKGVNGEYEADIELLIHQDKGKKPTAYVLAVRVEKKQPTASRSGDASIFMPLTAHETATRAEASSSALQSVVEDIQAEFPEIVKTAKSEILNLSVEAAKERGLFKGGVMETRNAVITEPGVSFAVRGSRIDAGNVSAEEGVRLAAAFLEVERALPEDRGAVEAGANIQKRPRSQQRRAGIFSRSCALADKSRPFQKRCYYKSRYSQEERRNKRRFVDAHNAFMILFL